MKREKILSLLKGVISPYSKYCDGYGNFGTSGNSYIIGFVLGTGKSNLDLIHDGSQALAETNAFDRAEVNNTNIGQINMSIVSSFCGPSGLIWGYDIAKVENLRSHHKLGIDEVSYKGKKIPVFTASPLLKATKKLFGTIRSKKFPLLPGSHVPCAGKNFKSIGPKHIYSAFALGVAEDRSKNACLLMEDLGWIPLSQNEISLKRYKQRILSNLAKSIAEVGINQKVGYKEIFLEMIDLKVPKGFVGCSLVAVPYFTLAKNAIPKEGIEKLSNMGLQEWETKI